MKHLLRVLLTLAAGSGLSPLAGAETLTRCIGPAGELTWSNVGCAPAERAEAMEVKPATVVDSRELRSWAKRSPPARTSAAPPTARRPAGSEARAPKMRDSVACENAQREYRFEADRRGPRRGGLGMLRDEVKRACAGI